MTETLLHQRGTTLVRRLHLEPGETTPWHRDPYPRVTVVLTGDALSIEYRDGEQPRRVEITSGQTDWDDPSDRVHRAFNTGRQGYEEVTIFFLDHPGAVPQPIAE